VSRDIRATGTRYLDPLDAIWLGAAERLGIHVERSTDVYAGYDGCGTLRVAESAQLDADDSLAQQVLHELCRALVMGEQALGRVDWGRTRAAADEPARELLLEHACHRPQAALCDRHGLRELLAVTKPDRPYWDALPADPLAPGDDAAIEHARGAWVRSRKTPWREVLHDALTATATIALAAQPFARADSPWALVRAAHPTGMALHRDPRLVCGDCAWFVAREGAATGRCRQTRHEAGDRGRRVERAGLACERHERRLDEAACGRCGACCRQGFDLVQVRPRDRIRSRHPELVREDRHGLHVPRPSGLCVALTGDGDVRAPYRCRVYEDRPRACADFALGGDTCLLARRRVGLSR
jgi:hypothetical protein